MPAPNTTGGQRALPKTDRCSVLYPSNEHQDDRGGRQLPQQPGGYAMDDSKSNDNARAVPAESAAGLQRRQFLGNVVKAAGGLLLGDLAAATAASAQPTGSPAPAGGAQKFTDWGWPPPYRQIGPESKRWLQN